MTFLRGDAAPKPEPKAAAPPPDARHDSGRPGLNAGGLRHVAPPER
jgi:hypothetical protein